MPSELNVARPEGFVVAIAPLRVAVGPVAIVAVICTPPWLTGLFAASRSCTDGCCANGVPLVPLADGSVSMVSLPAVPAVALVANVTGLPLSPVTEAWSWYAVPAVGRRVQLPTVATPCALVVGVSPETEPPFTAANVTLMPGTGFPLASVTRTAGAGDTVPPATVVAGIVTLAAMA